MSGQPYKTHLDITNARNAYLSNLKLRVELDDKNYQANKIYTRTGQLPSEMTDYRSTTEKIADIQRLKIDLNSKLLGITDGQQAQIIVTQLGPDQLIFLSQNFGPISEQIKKLYSLGVLAPIFINYLERYMDRFQQTNGVEFGLQQTSANNIIANQQTILTNMANTTDINNIMGLITKTSNHNVKFKNQIINNLQDLNQLTLKLPEIFNQISLENNVIQKAQMQEILNNIVSDLPNRDQMENVLTLLATEIQHNNIDGITMIMSRIQDLSHLGQDTLENVEIIKQMIRDYKPSQSETIPTANQYVPIPTTIQDEPILTAEQVTSVDPNDMTKKEIVSYFDTNWPELQKSLPPKYKSKSDFSREYIGKPYKSNNLNMAEMLKIVVQMDQHIKPPIQKQSESNTIPEIPVGKGIKGKGIKGKGIATIVIKRVNPSQVLDTDIDYTMGVVKAPKFVQIGKHLINKHRLDDNIVAIKRNGGSVIPSLPSQRVSMHVGNIIRKLLNGKTPEYDDYNELNNDDKLILDKIAKETQIKDRLQLPKPNKGDQDKDINQFEILKGEILAGNDNPDIVKKFKTMILKLSHNNLLPKGQAKDLLMDLINLGH